MKIELRAPSALQACKLINHVSGLNDRLFCADANANAFAFPALTCTLHFAKSRVGVCRPGRIVPPTVCFVVVNLDDGKVAIGLHDEAAVHAAVWTPIARPIYRFGPIDFQNTALPIWRRLLRRRIVARLFRL